MQKPMGRAAGLHAQRLGIIRVHVPELWNLYSGVRVESFSDPDESPTDGYRLVEAYKSLHYRIQIQVHRTTRNERSRQKKAPV